MTDEHLHAACDHVMKALTMLSAAAREAKEAKATRLSNDLYYAAERAWHELDAVKRRQSGAAGSDVA